jgi:hypothetical protein
MNLFDMLFFFAVVSVLFFEAVRWINRIPETGSRHGHCQAIPLEGVRSVGAEERC